MKTLKRNRGESCSSAPSTPPTKTHKRAKDHPVVNATAKKHAHHQHQHNITSVEASPSTPPVPVPVPVAVVEVPSNGHVEEVMGGGWWGVEEEVLLGWFPFVEEHFVWSMCRGGGGGGEEEEEEEGDQEDYDIWQLRHIHEIPNNTTSTNRA